MNSGGDRELQDKGGGGVVSHNSNEANIYALTLVACFFF